MKVLELFSGSGSVTKVCKELGYDCVSVDIDFESTHKVDILEFDYKQYKPDEFDMIWASPPCTYYSSLQRSWIGKKKKDGIYTEEKLQKDLEDSDKLVERTLEIIKYFNPHLWFIENPQTGTLKKREIVKDIPYYDVDYCMYSDWGYRKRTRVWTNKEGFNALRCDNKGTCGNMVSTGKHKKNVSIDCHNNKTDKKKHKEDVSITITNRLERYRVPPDLIKALFA